MCFSPTASFIAGGALIGAGVATRRLANTKAEKLFSLFPFFFAIQQLLEGALWMILLGKWPQVLKAFSVAGFLASAILVWPVLAPLTTYLFERNKLRKKILLIFLVGGILFSTIMLTLYFQGNVGAEIQNLHINYFTSSIPISAAAFNALKMFYLILVAIPFLISSDKRLNLGGLFIVIAYMITQYFYAQVFISVWCFFAAIGSLAIYFYIRSPNSLTNKSDKKLKLA